MPKIGSPGRFFTFIYVWGPNLCWGEGDLPAYKKSERMLHRAVQNQSLIQVLSVTVQEPFALHWLYRKPLETNLLTKTAFSVYCRKSGGMNTSLLPATFIPLALRVWKLCENTIAKTAYKNGISHKFVLKLCT